MFSLRKFMKNMRNQDDSFNWDFHFSLVDWMWPWYWLTIWHWFPSEPLFIYIQEKGIQYHWILPWWECIGWVNIFFVWSADVIKRNVFVVIFVFNCYLLWCRTRSFNFIFTMSTTLFKHVLWNSDKAGKSIRLWTHTSIPYFKITQQVMCPLGFPTQRASNS